MRNSKLKIQNLFLTFCIFHFTLFVSCKIPVLEKPECQQARQTVKKFYSYHFGNDMKFSPENLREREKYLTADFTQRLQSSPPGNDVFTTNSTDYPKAFRIGGCEVFAPDKTVLEVLLFWKDDTKSEQRAINVEVVKQADAWLIDQINY
jgi:hypothetical protein